MELSVGERLVLLSLLPQEGNFLTLKVIRKLQESLSFSEEEHKEYKFVQTGERVTWDDKANPFKDIEIGEKAMDIIIETLKKLDEEKKLTQDHYSLYEKFVEKQ